MRYHGRSATNRMAPPVYHFLFRNRWYALAWGVMTAVSAVMFTTTGAGAILTGTTAQPGPSKDAANQPVKQNAWAKDEPAAEEDSDPDPAEQAAEAAARDDNRVSDYNTAPYAAAGSKGMDEVTER